MFVRLNIGLLPSDAVKYPRCTQQAERLEWAAQWAARCLSGVVRMERRDGPHEPFLAIDGTHAQPMSVLRSRLHHLAISLDQDCIAAEVVLPHALERSLVGPRPGPWEPFREDLFYRIP